MASGMIGRRIISTPRWLDQNLMNNVLSTTNAFTGISTITLSKQPKNTLCLHLAEELADAFRRCEANSSIRATILTSNSRYNYFSDGLCLTDLYDQQFEHILTYWKSIRDLLLTIYAYKKPLVAIINGHANGVGSELTMAADYRVMKEGASMERNEYDSRGQQCCQRVGDEIFGSVRSKLISANDAFRAGIVDGVKADDEVLGAALSAATQMMQKPTEEFIYDKIKKRSSFIDDLSASNTDVALLTNMTLDPDIQSSLKSKLERKRL